MRKIFLPCGTQEPRLLRGIMHGTGPESGWDYIIVFIGLCIFLVTLFYSVKWLIQPGETARHHIKYFILNDEYYER
jgi:hypothetical protein